MAVRQERLVRLQKVFDRISSRLHATSLTRHELLDLATTLAILARLLRHTDHDMQGYALRTGPVSAAWPLYQLDECVRAVQRDRVTESDETIRTNVEEGLRYAREALEIVQQRDVS